MSQQQYFDLHASGIGYINRPRTVDVKKGRKGSAYKAFTISAIHGAGDALNTTVFDVLITGKQACVVINHYWDDIQDAINARKKVLISFKVSDFVPETFQFTKGERAGQTGVSLKGRLIHVNYLKIGNVIVDLAQFNQVDDVGINVDQDESNAYLAASQGE
jgi:hypothetical protein